MMPNEPAVPFTTPAMEGEQYGAAMRAVDCAEIAAANPAQPTAKELEAQFPAKMGTRLLPGPGRQAPQLDEKGLRRPEFVEGILVTLSDGQTWHFPPPKLGTWYPTRTADGRTQFDRAFDFGSDYDALTDALMEADGYYQHLVALADVTFDLLSRNYAITFEDMRHLLRVVPDGHPDAEANADMLTQLVEVALGRSGKEPTPLGSDAP